MLRVQRPSSSPSVQAADELPAPVGPVEGQVEDAVGLLLVALGDVGSGGGPARRGRPPPATAHARRAGRPPRRRDRRRPATTDRSPPSARPRRAPSTAGRATGTGRGPPASPRRTSTGSSYCLITSPRRSVDPGADPGEVGVEVTATRVASNMCSNNPNGTPPHRQRVKSGPGGAGGARRQERAQTSRRCAVVSRCHRKNESARPSMMTSAESTTKIVGEVGVEADRAHQHADARGRR